MGDFGVKAKNIYLGARGNLNVNVEGSYNTQVGGSTVFNTTNDTTLNTGGTMLQTASLIRDSADKIEHN